MTIEDDPPPGLPEWIVTFGDMMSLLLTFFIMLVSISDIKSHEKYDAIADSMRKQFGFSGSAAGRIPAWVSPRNPAIAAVLTNARAKKQETLLAGQRVHTSGDFLAVRVVRPGSKTAIGTSIFFDEQEAELSEQNQQELQVEALDLGGKPQRIEIRGHTGTGSLSAESGYADSWGLAYARCHKTMRFLVDELGIDPLRIRIAVAGPNEPVHLGSDPNKLRQNDRVEIYLLDEIANDPSETPEEQPPKLSNPAM